MQSEKDMKDATTPAAHDASPAPARTDDAPALDRRAFLKTAAAAGAGLAAAGIAAPTQAADDDPAARNRDTAAGTTKK